MKFRQTNHLHHIRKAKAVKPSLIYYQLQLEEQKKYFKYDFIMSKDNIILREIKNNDNTQISLIYYANTLEPCILRICKNRDLSTLCNELVNIRHPNLAVVYDYVYTNNNTYIIEEYINGNTVQEILERKGTFSEKETAQIMINVCFALEKLHGYKNKIIHNDINASNIMLGDDGSVKVFDFDISRIYKKGANKNTKLFGTENYASPEHYGFGQSDPRSDIYSLGVTMHEMLTGESLTSEHKIKYYGKIKNIIEKCVKVDIEQRWSSVRELRRALEAYIHLEHPLYYYDQTVYSNVNDSIQDSSTRVIKIERKKPRIFLKIIICALLAALTVLGMPKIFEFINELIRNYSYFL